jgi:hypothetical protein
MDDCSKKGCDTFFKDKGCKCYSVPDTAWPDEDQICAYLDDGVLFECDRECCAGTCPSRRCPNTVVPKPPDEILTLPNVGIVKNPRNVKNIFKFDAVFGLLLATIVFFLMLSGIALMLPELAVVIFVLCVASVYMYRNSLKAYLYNRSINIRQIWLLLNPSTLISLLSRKS